MQRIGMRTRIVAVLTAAMAVAVGVSAAQAKSSETVTLRMMSITSIQQAQEVLIKNFEHAYPNIKIEPTYVVGTAAFQTLLPQLQAGNAPDIMFVQPGNT